MKTTLSAKTTEGFMDGCIKKPTSQATDYQHWEKVDWMVMAWIINSINPSLHGSTHEMFGSILKSILMHLISIISPTLCLIQQESDFNVTDFYTKFKSFLDELSELQPLPDCTLDNELFTHVKAIILNSNPLPSLRRTFNQVLREESRFPIEKERSIKIVSRYAFNSSNTNRYKWRDRQRPKCDCCGKLRHNIVHSSCIDENKKKKSSTTGQALHGTHEKRSVGTQENMNECELAQEP
ncbi:hypothetical protein CR513_45426, partial [Mucuna pruriens]